MSEAITNMDAASKRPFGLGWRPDLPDFRDHRFSALLATLQILPPKVDLRAQCPPVVHQGQIGSCTGCAVASAHLFDQMKQTAAHPFQPSRLFIYYNERSMENTVSVDAGAYIRDGLKSIAKQGVCPETTWPYIESKFAARPPKTCYEDALFHQAIEYSRIDQNLNQQRGCIAGGYPFVFGFTVYDSFMSDAVEATGIVPLPSQGESSPGGHAVMAVGYDDAAQRFIVQNSWGVDWGDKGYFYMPYSYLIDTDLAADFWCVRVVEV